jgi:hypothetical protein
MIVTDLINDTLRPKGRFEQKRVMTLSSFLSALMYGFMPLFKNGFEVKEFVFLGFLAIGGFTVFRTQKSNNNDNTTE